MPNATTVAAKRSRREANAKGRAKARTDRNPNAGGVDVLNNLDDREVHLPGDREAPPQRAFSPREITQPSTVIAPYGIVRRDEFRKVTTGHDKTALTAA